METVSTLFKVTSVVKVTFILASKEISMTHVYCCSLEGYQDALALMFVLKREAWVIFPFYAKVYSTW